MRLERIELHLIHLDLIAPFETSFGTTTSRSIILVSVESGNHRGWGECTAPEAPLFNEEFTESAWAVLSKFLVPLAQRSVLDDPAHLAVRFEGIRGHRMAKAALETACWDLFARQKGVPLWTLLGSSRHEISCGVSIGLQPTISQLLDNVDRELSAGYRRIKIKIAPGRDLDLVRAVRAKFGDITLSVDANSAYTLADIDVLKELDAYRLLMIEQPLRPGDLLDHARLQAELQTAICLDESIVDDESARQAIEVRACRIVNIKLGRVGGHNEAHRIADRCQSAGIDVWCGGMLEAGIGRLHNAAMSTNAGFTLPGDVSDSRRYWRRDVVHPRPTVNESGVLTLSQAAGIGAEVDSEFVASIRSLHKVFAV